MINKLQEDLKQAMRDKNVNTLNVLRSLKNEITNTSLRKGSVNEVVSDSEIIGLIRKEISKRQDSINAFVSANRQDLIVKENSEIEILSKYLPIDLTDDELKGIVFLAMSEFETPTKKDMGKIIKKVAEVANGRADNKRISSMVGSQLA